MEHDEASRCQVTSVAIFRALHLGDMLCSVPALRAWRSLWPEARITLVGLPWAEAFAQRFRAYVDDFVAFPGHPALPEGGPPGLRYPAFEGAIRERRFDLAVQLHGSGLVSNGIVARFGARCVVGFAPAGSAVPASSRFLRYPDHGREVERLLALAKHLGAKELSRELEFPIEPAERAAAAAFVPAGRAYAVVHPGASTPEKRWSVDGFARVADALGARGLAVILTGSEAERELTAGLALRMNDCAIDAAGKTSVGELAALVAGAEVLICNDTGVSHLADATDTPSAVVYLDSDPERWAPADNRLHRVIDLRHGRDGAAETVMAEVGAILEERVRHAVA